MAPRGKVDAMNHERRNAEARARLSKRHRDRDAWADARTDRWIEAARRLGLDDDLAAAHGHATLEEAVEALRRTLGK